MSAVCGKVSHSLPSSIDTTLGTPKRKVAKVEVSRENPDNTLCSCFLVQKRRFCRTKRCPGLRFCHTHCVYSDLTDFYRDGNQDSKVLTHMSNNTATPFDDEKDMNICYNSNMLRVPCPINPNHTVYRSRLDKHIQVCPDLRFVNKGLSYFRENYHANSSLYLACTANTNSGAEKPVNLETRGLKNEPVMNYTHRSLSEEDLERFIVRVTNCYNNFIEPEIVVLGEQSDSCFSAEMHNIMGTNVQQSKKHAPQHQGILRCLGEALTRYYQEYRENQLQDPPQKPFRCLKGFLEFGAGKGSLSVALQQVLVSCMALREKESSEGVHSAATLECLFPFLRHVSPCPVVGVVDMDSFRRKGDARVSHSRIPLCRLRINLKDLDLTEAFVSKVFTVPHTPPQGALGSVKAGFNDEVLQDEKDENALFRTSIQQEVSDWAVLGKHLCGACTDFALSCITEKDLGLRAHVRIWLVVLATCCHHRCELKHLNPVVRAPASVNGAQFSFNVALQLPGTDFAITAREFACLASMSSWAVSGSFVEESRRKVGYYCKRILDMFRVSYLRQHGFNAWLCQYTERAVTEENVCIVAYKND